MKQAGINATPNKSNKITFKPIGFFKGATKIIAEIATTRSITGVVEGIFDTIDSFKLDKKPEYIAYVLINRSLLKALAELLSEPVEGLRFTDKEFETGDLEKELIKTFQENPVIITRDFFKQPKELKLLDNIILIFKEYLSYFELNENIINNILRRFKSYFAIELAIEWGKHPQYYDQLFKSLDTPFNEAEEREYKWFFYRQYLQSLPQQKVFNESFGLSDIYIKLRAYCKKITDNEHLQKVRNTEEKHKVFYIDDYLQEWIKNDNKKDAIKIISGGPGYGKSSLLKVFAASLAEQQMNVLFIPLHLFDIKDDLELSIYNFLQQNRYLSENPLFDNEKLIIIFDGLDELYVHGRTLADTAQKFLHEVHMKVMQYNNSFAKLKIIISGRDVIIQQNELEFRGKEKILQLLPYYLEILEPNIRENITGEEDILEKDQRNEWWKCYGCLKGIDYKGLPDKLKNEELDEITSQPLLNYLIALSYNKDFNFDKNSNLNDIYDKLIKDVYNRGYSESGALKPVSGLSELQFMTLLKEIAMCVWYGNSRTTTIGDIKERLKGTRLEKYLKGFEKDAEKGVLSLLTAFYFRQAVNMDCHTFEFTHKSFGEYLTAAKIIENVTDICINIYDYENTGDKGCPADKGIVKWIELFGHKALDEDIVKFLRNEVEKKSLKELRIFQNSVVSLINYSLTNWMPVENVLINKPQQNFNEWKKYSKNSETALYIIHGIIADKTDIVSEVNWVYGKGFHNLLTRIDDDNNYVNSFFNHLNFKWQEINYEDLDKVNFKKGIFLNTSINYSNLFGDLRNTNMRGIYIYKSFLGYSGFDDSNLRNSVFTETDFFRTSLSNSDLSNTQFDKCDMSGANLMDVNLTDSKLQNTDLTEANLCGANLVNCDLVNVNLKAADLTAVNFKGASLTNVILVNARFYTKNLIEAKTLKGSVVTKEQYEKMKKDLRKPGINIEDLGLKILGSE